MGELVLPLVEGPRRKPEVLKCCSDGFKIPVHISWGRNCFGPVCQGIEDTLFCCDVVATVPM